MADTASRPAPTRARGSGRGGRGGSRSTFRSTRDRTNGDHQNESAAFDDSIEQGEIGEMKKQYSSQLSTLKELFPDWTDVDLLFALQETGGDLQSAVERISEGHVSQFADVKHHKERVKPKSKDNFLPASDAGYSTGPVRGRGRADRGRGGFRGGRGGHVSSNGVRSTSAAVSTPTAEAQGWGAAAADDDAKGAEAEGTSQWGKVVTAKTTPAAASEGAKKSLLPEGPPKKTWAQMFAKPISAPVPPQPAVSSAAPAEAIAPPVEEPVPDEPIESQEEAAIPPVADDVSVTESFEMVEPPEIGGEESTVDISPPREQLTQENVEHLPDASHPPPTGTQASTVDSASRGPDSATPSVVAQASQAAPTGRPGMGGFATTAYKATSTSGTRSASFQRRLMDQQESVVMPGSHNTVERTALQFGSMGLNGDADSPDVDEEREEAETRAQPPQHSPPSQPRAALPPVARQGATALEAQQEPAPTTKPAPGLPPAPQQQQLSQQSPPGQITSQLASQQAAQGNQSYGQFGRNNQDSFTAGQKNYDPFGNQQSQQSSFDNYGSQSHTSAQSQQQSSQIGGYSSAANDYSSYYTSADQRNAYQNYYGGAYGPQSTSQQDAGVAQQRTGSAFGGPASTAGDSGYPSTQGQQSQSRFSENQASGNNTPNPPVGGQQQTGTPSQHMQQPHSQNQQHSGYPYGAGGYGGHYSRMDPYYAAYMNQQYGGYGQGGYGNSFSSKGNMYGQPHHGYGMSPGSGYDQHGLTQASGGSFGQSSVQNRDSGFGSSGLGSGLGSEYTRSGSTQPSQNQQTSSGAGFGGVHDVFGRSGSGYPSQGQQYGQQSSSSQGDDSLKPFGDNKATGGPSPNSLNQPGRPGSATNTGGQSSSLPQAQSATQQHGFGGYPSNYSQMQGSQSSQYGNLGGLGGHQGGQSHQSGYGGGYGAGFGGSYGSYGGRGGWGGGGNYGQH